MNDGPRSRPVLVYDGDCGICTRCVAFVEAHLTKDVDIIAFQHADLAALRLTAEECEAAVQWVQPDGRVSAAHLAVGDLLAASGLRWRPLAFLARTPPFSWVAGLAYRWIARNRHRLPGGTPACSMPAHLRPGAASSTAPRAGERP
ncbi:thiol-disulfide oxidoreductase DCC family protein [Cumulibacter manganitolerans]|uniref:thiol-disulfide oxidoreductase DCC family protein n=1 Tax=Cumulibacter manganitolerans TaxID=1884992 RepID=UPI001294AE08|nr:DUF393 domain-containing protein [Cumulibacter manganitolerans]